MFAPQLAWLNLSHVGGEFTRETFRTVLNADYLSEGVWFMSEREWLPSAVRILPPDNGDRRELRSTPSSFGNARLVSAIRGNPERAPRQSLLLAPQQPQLLRQSNQKHDQHAGSQNQRGDGDCPDQVII